MFDAIHDSGEDHSEIDDNWGDSARNCIGSKEDIIKNGEPF